MKKLGEGGSSEVFALADGRLLKLFYPRTSSYADVEARNIRWAEAAGLPVQSVGALIERDGRRGILFENVELGVTLKRRVRTRPWTLIQAARAFAELHALLHACNLPQLPPQRVELAREIEASEVLDRRMKRVALKALSELPDGTAICHNDFHLENVIVGTTGMVVIDWIWATRGDPLSDVAATLLFLRLGAIPNFTIARQATNKARAFFERIYLRRYMELRPAPVEQIRAWQLPVAAALTYHQTYPRRQRQLLAMIEALI